MSKIEKTLARQKEKIDEGQFYEAHQQFRVIANRYLAAKPPAYASAIDLLTSGAHLLLKAQQGGSGGDLCLFLVDTYKKAATACTSDSRGRLVSLLRAFPAGEPVRKRFVGECVAWSAKHGEFPAGDPELHHVAGTLLAEEDGDAYAAERHLALGTRDSPPVLARLEHAWYTQSPPHTAPLFASRAVFPYLVLGNLRGAKVAYQLFTSLLAASTMPQSVEVGKNEVQVFPSLPLLNFIGLLLLACQRGTPELWNLLKAHYADMIGELEGAWDEALEGIAEQWFGVRKPVQGNPLFDMLGGMFGGGGMQR